jgi:UDP-N-acetylglucosamine--N-acetylmuramyl-(pentapeptide) pyrophosphoryl-undecaprenol N-acetylglucosamine transferase
MPDVASAGTAPLVCLTGGGTAGHVVPHLALLPLLRAAGCEVMYVGGAGIEQELMRKVPGVEFHAVATGKLRRYLSLKNLADLFRIAWGALQSLGILIRRRPGVVFSKGGYVAVPVCAAARLLGVPVVTHESDLTPGLATKLIAPLARRVLYTFPETAQYLRPGALHTGTPMRAELLEGDGVKGLAACGFDPSERIPTIMVMGGSQGALRINEALLGALPELCQRARVIHLTGKGKAVAFVHPRYKAFEYVSEGLADLYAAADVIVARAGANSIFEVLALKKPMLLIPLEQGSRGDQVLNAESFVRHGWARVLRDRDLTPARLIEALSALEREGAAMRAAQAGFDAAAATGRVAGVILEVMGKRAPEPVLGAAR